MFDPKYQRTLVNKLQEVGLLPEKHCVYRPLKDFEAASEEDKRKE